MQYEDRIRISTPEGVDLELTLAGLGSRTAAALLDTAIRLFVYLMVGLLFGVFAAAGVSSIPLGLAVFIAAVLALEIGYDILFETLGSGRTPGKRAAGLRVVQLGGNAVDFRTSAVRNLLRLIDGPLTGWVAGVVCILATSRNQRLGDLAAGTIVVRERRASAEGHYEPVHPTARPSDLAVWDVSAVTDAEVGAVRRFCERRTTLTYEARGRIARELATRLRPKVAGAPDQMHPEAFLEALLAAKAGRG